jgi:predicted Zn-dependent peptidase
VAVNAGTRDELKNEFGIAHFVEHVLFKGTKKRSSWQIIDRLEAVGGEIDAYTTKEETFIYTVIPQKYCERAVELLADILFHSTFPQEELEKEKTVILDEIQSYNDSPSELIFDEFEELVFANSPLEHNILGTKKSLKKLLPTHLQKFVNRCYTTDNILFFVHGNIYPEKIVRYVEKYFDTPTSKRNFERTLPNIYLPQSIEKKKDTCQTHCLIGNRALHFGHKNRLTQVLLNNILGGPLLGSRLNLAVRERNGLVYSIDSSLTPYTDTGVWNIYFGCDKNNFNKCIELIYKELDVLRNKEISEKDLKKAKKQFAGQMLISHQNKENFILNAAKSVLHLNFCETQEKIIEKINQITAHDLQKIAQELFNIEKVTILKFI